MYLILLILFKKFFFLCIKASTLKCFFVDSFFIKLKPKNPDPPVTKIFFSPL